MTIYSAIHSWSDVVRALSRLEHNPGRGSMLLCFAIELPRTRNLKLYQYITNLSNSYDDFDICDAAMCGKIRNSQMKKIVTYRTRNPNCVAQRLCHCGASIEDEQHVLQDRPSVQQIRDSYQKPLGYPDTLQNSSEIQDLKYINDIVAYYQWALSMLFVYSLECLSHAYYLT